MPEVEYMVEGSGGKGQKKTANQKTAPEWASALEAFTLPEIAGDEFLSGCKVRVQTGGCLVCFNWGFHT